MSPLRYAAYAFFFLFSLVWSLYLTFPWESVADRILAIASERSGMDIAAKSIEPHWVTGIIAKELSIKPREAEEPIEIAEVRARASVLELLRGNTGVSVQLPIARGNIDLEVVQSDQGIGFVGAVNKVNLALIPGLKDTIGLPLSGVISLAGDLYIDKKDGKKSEGEVNLEASELQIEKGGTVSMFPVPEFAVGSFKWKIPVSEGKAKFEKQRIDGENIELILDGDISLGASMAKSTANLVLSARPTPAFLKKEPLLSALLNNIRRAKGSDGFYTYAMSGSLARPRFFPKRTK